MGLGLPAASRPALRAAPSYQNRAQGRTLLRFEHALAAHLLVMTGENTSLPIPCFCGETLTAVQSSPLGPKGGAARRPCANYQRVCRAATLRAAWRTR